MFRTGERNDCSLRMHVTDVQRPLISVSRVCDAGHTVTLTSQGGYIQHEGTGRVTDFYRDHSVYRIAVQPMEHGGQGMGFTWRGK